MQLDIPIGNLGQWISFRIIISIRSCFIHEAKEDNMYSKGEYEFLGYLVQRSDNALLILVPDDIPDVENTQEDLDRLEPGIMVFGVGQISITKNALPEVFLKIFHVLWRKREGLAIPSFLIETTLDEVTVSSHLRNLPAGMRASEEQIRKALKKGIILPDGYTYVSDHERKI